MEARSSEYENLDRLQFTISRELRSNEYCLDNLNMTISATMSTDALGMKGGIINNIEILFLLENMTLVMYI